MKNKVSKVKPAKKAVVQDIIKVIYNSNKAVELTKQYIKTIENIEPSKKPIATSILK